MSYVICEEGANGLHDESMYRLVISECLAVIMGQTYK